MARSALRRKQGSWKRQYLNHYNAKSLNPRRHGGLSCAKTAVKCICEDAEDLLCDAVPRRCHVYHTILSTVISAVQQQSNALCHKRAGPRNEPLALRPGKNKK
jgi:hypothetical protein